MHHVALAEEAPLLVGDVQESVCVVEQPAHGSSRRVLAEPSVCRECLREV